MNVMENIEKNQKELLNKLKIAQSIYQKAATKVHDTMTTSKLEAIKEQKEVALNEVAKIFQIDIKNYTVGTRDLLKQTLEKVGLEVDHLYLRMNEGEVLSFCIKRETELLECYQNVLNDSEIDMDNSSRALLESQMDVCSALLTDLKENKAPYNF